MAFIVLKCPSCGAEINLDKNREFGFCSFCGTKIIQDKQIIEHRVINDHSSDVNGYLFLAQRCLEKGDIDAAELYYEKILAIEPTNETANIKLKEIDTIVRIDNVFVKRLSCLVDASTKFKVQIDGKNVAKLAPEETLKISLPIGMHTICVPGPRKSKVIEFEIKNNRENFCFAVKNGFGKINIERVKQL